MSLIIDMDYVIIEGQRVNRPVFKSRSSWLRQWELTQSYWQDSWAFR